MRDWRRSWLVVAAGLAILVYITYNTVTTPGTSSSGLEAGAQMPDFAAPLVTSDLEGDANVATRADQGPAGAVPACDVDDPRALVSCELTRRGPVALAFLTEGAGRCVDALDAMAEVAPDHPDVAFAAVAIRGDRDDLRKLAREHGWDFPVAQDSDGAVANLYGVAICPAVVLARRDGEVAQTLIGDEETTARALERALRELEDANPAAAAGTGTATTSGPRP